VALVDLIQQDPEGLVGETVWSRFGELPYLFKVLDVNDMLSIQVHPTKSEAEKGFDAEEAAGVPRHAPHRNYKDRNHKPEVMVALSEFWLLHGFKKAAAIEETLLSIIEFNVFLPLYRKEGLAAFYQLLMEMDQTDVNSLLMPLVKREIRRKQNGELDPHQPGWWVAKWYEKTGLTDQIDRGIFSIYLFNIVKVEPGEAVFQKAGIPHAYLQGQNMELMANSDNVLRGGLTPKHVDVPELMKHTLFEDTIPQVMKGQPLRVGETLYPCPVPDFGLSRIVLDGSMSYVAQAHSLEIFMVIEGGVVINQSLVAKKGEAFAVLVGEDYQLTASGKATLYKAFVPQ
jgi:mannose-6-phosphate isomerase